MKNHLKRIAVPKTWIINRKDDKFIIRPSSGTHNLENGMALGYILRDILGLAKTMAEVKGMLYNKEILVDGKRRKEHSFMVGLFDVISIPSLKKAYRIVFDEKGRIIVKEIAESESKVKPCKILGKTAIARGKIQYNLYDGKNIIVASRGSGSGNGSDSGNSSEAAKGGAKVGDSLIVEVPALQIRKTMPLKEGAYVYIEKGKNAGGHGLLKEMRGEIAIYESNGKKVETMKKYLFVVGEKKPEVQL
jgi:small subunit ribosomal protein S4e